MAIVWWLLVVNYCTRCREKGKGSDPCLSKQDCSFCNLLTSDQCAQLATPSYKLKKEKRDFKDKSDKFKPSEAVVNTSSPHLGPGTGVVSGGCGQPGHC